MQGIVQCFSGLTHYPRNAVRQQIYDFLYDENTGLPVDDYTPDEIPVLRDRVFQHVYRTYPTVPSPYFRV
jgi:type I restriction enzyme R subunit